MLPSLYLGDQFIVIRIPLLELLPFVLSDPVVVLYTMLFTSVSLLLTITRLILTEPSPGNAQILISTSDVYASPLDPTWTPASEIILQPSPTYTIAPPQNLTIDSEPSANTALSRKFVDSRCSVQQRKAIEAAWYEASLLDQAQQKYVPGGAFSTAMINYFGKNVGSTGGILPWDRNYRKLIGDNIARRHALDTNNAPRSTYLYFYCYDWFQNYCHNHPNVVAGYTHSQIGTFWTNHYITFCDLYFTKPTLMDSIRRVNAMPNPAAEKNVLDNFYSNRATILYHETYHLKNTVVQPNTKDYANAPLGIWEQAKLKGAYWSYVTRKLICQVKAND